METNQPGLPGFRFSQTLSLIKVAMMANKEQEETIPDDSYQITCTKISQEFKEEVIPRGGYSHTLPIWICAAQRGRDFEAPDLEWGIHFRGVF